MARGITGHADAGSKQDEKIQVLNTNPFPKEVDLSPKNGQLDASFDPTDRRSVDPNVAAPIVRNALDAPPLRVGLGVTNPVMVGSSEEEAPKVRVYRVEAEKSIVDRTSGARTKLREGKEITSQHYDIRDLQRQGVKLRDITDVDPNAPL